MEDADTAYLVEASSADAFGRRLLDALRDPAAATEVGRRGREVALREFDYRRYGEVLRDWFAALSEREAKS